MEHSRPHSQQAGIQVEDKYPVLKFFSYAHLPQPLMDISKPFCLLAHQMAETLPPGPEVSAGLRKLLEAKDCAVRAAL